MLLLLLLRTSSIWCWTTGCRCCRRFKVAERSVVLGCITVPEVFHRRWGCGGWRGRRRRCSRWMMMMVTVVMVMAHIVGIVRLKKLKICVVWFCALYSFSPWRQIFSFTTTLYCTHHTMGHLWHFHSLKNGSRTFTHTVLEFRFTSKCLRFVNGELENRAIHSQNYIYIYTCRAANIALRRCMDFEMDIYMRMDDWRRRSSPCGAAARRCAQRRKRPSSRVVQRSAALAHIHTNRFRDGKQRQSASV